MGFLAKTCLAGKLPLPPRKQWHFILKAASLTLRCECVYFCVSDTPACSSAYRPTRLMNIHVTFERELLKQWHIITVSYWKIKTCETIKICVTPHGALAVLCPFWYCWKFDCIAGLVKLWYITLAWRKLSYTVLHTTSSFIQIPLYSTANLLQTSCLAGLNFFSVHYCNDFFSFDTLKYIYMVSHWGSFT